MAGLAARLLERGAGLHRGRRAWGGHRRRRRKRRCPDCEGGIGAADAGADISPLRPEGRRSRTPEGHAARSPGALAERPGRCRTKVPCREQAAFPSPSALHAQDELLPSGRASGPATGGHRRDLAFGSRTVGASIALHGEGGEHDERPKTGLLADSPGVVDIRGGCALDGRVRADSIQEAQHPRDLRRRHRHHQRQRLQRRPDGLRDAQHRSHRQGGPPLPPLLRRAELHRRPRGVSSPASTASAPASPRSASRARRWG